MNSLKLAAILYKLSSLSRLAAAIFLLPATLRCCCLTKNLQFIPEAFHTLGGKMLFQLVSI